MAPARRPDGPIQQAFFHGTTVKAARSIARRGFVVWHDDDPRGRYPGGGNLGTGVYVTPDWRIATMFGPAVLLVRTHHGVRVLDCAQAANPKVISYLTREFGRDILEQPPHRALPRNKHLRGGELIELARYQYRRGWPRGDKESAKAWKRSASHRELFRSLRGDLLQAGYSAVGDSVSDNGLVFFDGADLIVENIVGVIPNSRDGYRDVTLDSVCSQFGPAASSQAAAIARLIQSRS